MTRFKVGDKVLHSDTDYHRYFNHQPRNEVGIVSGVDVESKYPISVDWPHYGGEWYPHLPEEIVPYAPEEG